MANLLCFGSPACNKRKQCKKWFTDKGIEDQCRAVANDTDGKAPTDACDFIQNYYMGGESAYIAETGIDPCQGGESLESFKKKQGWTSAIKPVYIAAAGGAIILIMILIIYFTGKK